MKTLEIRIKHFPFREVEETVEALYRSGLSVHLNRRRIKVNDAKAVAVACYLKVDDYFLELLLSSDRL